MASPKFESDDGGAPTSTANGPSPSPSPLAASQDAAYTDSFFMPVGAVQPSSIDSDVHMTDVTDDGAATTAAAPLTKRERLSSPLSTSTAATSSATRKKTRPSGPRAAAAAARRGTASVKRKTLELAARSSPSATRNKASGAAKATEASRASPNVKREPESDNDDGDNEEEDDDDDDDDDDVRRGRGIPPSVRRTLRHSDDGTSDDAHGSSVPLDEGASSDNGPYCICRGPDDHRWMIQCDECEDWFHGDCVAISKEDGEDMILSYICPNCTIPGRYVTRFKKLCSLPGCRKAARLYADESASPLPYDTASHFCCDAHRDQWWDGLLSRLDRSRPIAAAGTIAAATAEAKMAVDQLTPAQLLFVLSHTDQPGVAQMLLHGLAPESNDNIDALMTDEERTMTQASAARRYELSEQVAMCKKMLQLLDMARTRSQDAIKAGHMERDCCGYDDRLQHVCVQPHFEYFLASLEGQAIFRAEALGAPQFDDDGHAIGDGGEAAADAEQDQDTTAATAGMCRKRKCKAHASWFPTLARDVRMQIQECTRQAAALRDNETRIRHATVQRVFVVQHSASQVRYVDDSDDSLTSLASDMPKSSDDEGCTTHDRDLAVDDDDDNSDVPVPIRRHGKTRPSAKSSVYNGYSRSSQQSSKSVNGVDGGHGMNGLQSANGAGSTHDIRSNSSSHRYGSRSPNSEGGRLNG